MASRSTRILLLTGRPGAGKTTVLRRAAAGLAGCRVAGVYAQEMRSRGERTGFRLSTFDGATVRMAHVGITGPRVSRYGVDVAAIEALAVPALLVHPEVDVYLVDEIGKMECLAPGFVAAMQRLLESPRLVVATVALRGSGLIAEVKVRRDAELWDVTRESREAMPNRVLAWLHARGIGGRNLATPG